MKENRSAGERCAGVVFLLFRDIDTYDNWSYTVLLLVGVYILGTRLGKEEWYSEV